MTKNRYFYEALKSCPFCGERPLMNQFVSGASPTGFAIYWVKCEKCGAEIAEASATEEEATLKWNNRKDDVHELTKEEYEAWKKDPKRDPICKLWDGDSTPLWALRPEEIHEPAFLMEKLKLFNGKPNKNGKTNKQLLWHTKGFTPLPKDGSICDIIINENPDGIALLCAVVRNRRFFLNELDLTDYVTKWHLIPGIIYNDGYVKWDR